MREGRERERGERERVVFSLRSFFVVSFVGLLFFCCVPHVASLSFFSSVSSLISLYELSLSGRRALRSLYLF